MTLSDAPDAWRKSSWGWLSLLLAVFTVLSVARMEIRPPVSPDFLDLASFVTYDFAILSAIGSLLRGERPFYPAMLGLLVLVIASLFMPGGLAWLPLFFMMSLLIVMSWWGIASAAGFLLLLWLLHKMSRKRERPVQDPLDQKRSSHRVANSTFPHI